MSLQRRGGKLQTLDVAHLLNCSGPDTNIKRCSHALLKSLLAHGFIEPGPLDMGIGVNPDYRVKGKAAGIFALGPLLAGEKF